MKHIRKLFGGLHMTWPKVLIFAVLSAVWSAVLLLLPVDLDVAGMGSAFPWWILFALIIITNCEKPLASACKTFVFFLVSQPLIYIFQAPFSALGLGLLRYYPPWFLMTLLTFPGGWLGWYLRKKGIFPGILLSPMIFLCAETGWLYLSIAVEVFPRDMLSLASAVFCAAECVLLFAVILTERKQRIIAGIIAVLLVLGAAFYESHRLWSGTVYCLPDDIKAADIGEITVADSAILRVSVDEESNLSDPAHNYLSVETKGEDWTSEFTVYGKNGEVLLCCEVRNVKKPDSNPENLLGYYQTIEFEKKEP